MKQKIELIKAFTLLADFWGVEPADLLCFTSLMKPEKREEWNKIVKDVISFQQMSFEDKVRTMGYEVKEVKKAASV